MADGGDPQMPGWFDPLLATAPFLVAFVGHLIRTETTRAILRRDVDALQRQRNEDLERLDKRLDEIGADIKTLLARR